jgi:hypothetical protein
VRAFDWVFRSRETGDIVIAQWPNVPLAVFIVARGLDWLVDPGTPWSTVLSVVGTVALVWWAVDEIVRGVNPWRRFLGAGVLAVLLVGIIAR